MAEAPLEGLTEGDLAPRPTGVWGVTKREPKPSLKIKTASAIFWIYFGIFRDCGLKHIFF